MLAKPARYGFGKHDIAEELGINLVNEALDAVSAFYPNQVLEPKTRFGLEEIFGSMLDGGSEGARPP